MNHYLVVLMMLFAMACVITRALAELRWVRYNIKNVAKVMVALILGPFTLLYAAFSDKKA